MNANHYNHQKLAEWRRDSRKSQGEIAVELGVDRNTVNRAETGKVASYELLANFCRIYGKSTHELIYKTPIAAAI